jgi:inorganic pyrophosphatase/exopolyphosphatase
VEEPNNHNTSNQQPAKVTMAPVQQEQKDETGPPAAAANHGGPSRRMSYVHEPTWPRDQTLLEHAVEEVWEEAEMFAKKVPSEQKETLPYAPTLTDAIFCGHIMADLDSIAGAIGAAYLYGGTPARASEINSETVWALEKWGCFQPETIEALLTETPDRNVCLVDFQQQSQLNPCIPMRNIVGIIDHHALQSNTIVTEGPIFVDIRPWGCMSSILAHSYAVQETHLPVNIAGMLLSAILSDTLNLRSPTTTVWDERMVSMLVQYTDTHDVNELAARQFRAKSHELSVMSPFQLVNGDMKTFKFSATINYEDETKDTDAAAATVYSIGFGVIETTDADASMARIQHLTPEMRMVREEKNLTAYFLAVVDIVHMTSSLLICGAVEESLAVAAYGGTVTTTPTDTDTGTVKNNVVLQLTGLVSRKKDFVPPLTRAVASGWHPPVLSTGAESPEQLIQYKRRRKSSIVMEYDKFGPGRLERVFSDDDDDEEKGDSTAMEVVPEDAKEE